MDKQAFSSVWQFMRRNWKIALLMIALTFGVTFGEHQLSTVLRQADLKVLDYGLAVIRLILQTALSTVLVFLWHKQNNSAAPFAAVDILKLFLPNLVVTLLLSFCTVLIVTFPLAVWLYLRLDFYMNEYITGRSNGIFSCIGGSFRRSKGYTKRYFVYNIKYLLFYFVIEFAITGIAVLGAVQGGGLPLENSQTALDVFEVVFLSIFMPYRFLIKCGFYSTYLQGEET